MAELGHVLHQGSLPDSSAGYKSTNKREGEGEIDGGKLLSPRQLSSSIR